MRTLVALSMLALVTVAAGAQEGKRIPDDSVELTVIGCLKGRVLTTRPAREVDVQSGPNVGERTFWLNGKRDVMAEVKKRSRHLVEVVGVVKRSDLDDKGVKTGRIAVSGGPPVAGTGRPTTGAENVPVMDVSAVRVRGTSCEVD